MFWYIFWASCHVLWLGIFLGDCLWLTRWISKVYYDVFILQPQNYQCELWDNKVIDLSGLGKYTTTTKSINLVRCQQIEPDNYTSTRFTIIITGGFRHELQALSEIERTSWIDGICDLCGICKWWLSDSIALKLFGVLVLEHCVVGHLKNEGTELLVMVQQKCHIFNKAELWMWSINYNRLTVCNVTVVTFRTIVTAVTASTAVGIFEYDLKTTIVFMAFQKWQFNVCPISNNAVIEPVTVT